MKKAVSLVLVCVLSLCLLLSGCGKDGSGLGGLSDVFASSSGNNDDRNNNNNNSSNNNNNNNNNNNSNSGNNSNNNSSNAAGDFSVDLSQGEYSKGDEYGYLGEVMHTYWFNFAVDKAYTCRTYGGYTAPDDCLLLVLRIGVKNTYGRSVDMYDDDFPVWWTDSDDDAYASLLTTRTDIAEDEIHVDAPLSDDMFPETYLLGINETRVGELIYQVPALDKSGRENRDFTVAFVEVFNTDNEDEMIGDYYFIDFTAESRSPVTPSAAQPSSQPSAEPSAEPSNQPSASGEGDNSGLKVIYASDGNLNWVLLHTGSYTEGEDERAGMGEVLHTYWFNFLVDEAYTCASYGDYTAPEGQQLLVVHTVILNTTQDSVPMFDDDFCVFWTSGETDGISFPLSTGEEYEGIRPHIDALLSDLQLPESYDIPTSAAVEGELIFQVPTDYDEEFGFVLNFEEYFDSNVEGDSYYVFLDVEAR